MSKELLEIKDLHVNAGEKEILKGLNLKINKGEVHVIMGPNGAGKSTLANVILNNPEYTKTSGTVEFEGENINDLSTDKIAKKGIFMSFQPEYLKMITNLIERNLNVGFSGGEKKKNEILQMLVLNPKLAILDETDSGLDVDAIKIVSKGIEMFKNDDNAVLIITHNTRILNHLKVDYVHVLVNGQIVKTSTAELAEQIEETGYAQYKK